MEYREANINEINELVKIRLEMRKENDINFDLSEMEIATLAFLKRTMSNNTHIEFIAIENKQIIATIGVSLFEVPPITSLMNGKTARMMNVYTIPCYRRQGIATKLLQYAITYLREIGYAKITLHSSEVGKYLYQGNGFKVSDNEYHFNI